MSLTTPTTQDIADNLLAQIESSISQSVPLLPKAFVRVLAKALAGVFILLYKYAGWIFLQQFVSSASMKETVINGRTIRPLLDWGRMIGVGDPEPATRAELLVEVVVTQQTGTLDTGEQLLFASSGVVYLTTAAVALDAPTVQVSIRASSDQQGGGGEGVIGNLEIGDVVSFASPLANIERAARVISQLVTGGDGESDDAYRLRVVERFQRPPQGGAYADYRTWGEEIAGIVRIYPYTADWPGEVDVYVQATPASSGSPDGFPTAAQITAVSDAIEQNEGGKATRRPIGAAVNVRPITRRLYDMTVTALASPGDASVITVRAAILAALDEHLRSREPFIVGLSVLPRRDLISPPALGGVAEEAASALGAMFTSFTFAGSSSTTALRAGELAGLGTVTFD